MTTKATIVALLSEANRPLAVHEIPVPMTSETAISARLRELARDGIVIGERHPVKPYKIWRVAPDQGVLL